MAYFDHNATTPLSRAARAAWIEASEDAWQNPSGPYRAGARVRNRLEAGRERLGDFLACPGESLVFTSGATEGNNALFAWLARRAGPEDRVLLSAVEHPSVREAAMRWFPGRTEFIPVDRDGAVDPEAVRRELRRKRPGLVSVMAANNETGVVQPFETLAALCREAGVWFHCDAAQWIGKMPAARLEGCDFVTGSAHKFGGPKGVGFLRVPVSADDFQGQVGGEQEHRRRAGTENYPAIAAMVAALEEREVAGFADVDERIARRAAFESRLAEAVPGVRIAGTGKERLWNTVSIIVPRHRNHRWVMKLDREGFAVSTGSACSSGDEAPSPVLAAMGYGVEEARRAVRVSAGTETGEADWSGLGEAFARVWRTWEDRGTDSSLTEVVSI